jgi:hypothetical protein
MNRAWLQVRGRRTLAAFLFASVSLLAGPPYLTDDPEPVDLHHWELYLFTAGQVSSGRASGLGPAMEANYGPFEDVQLQIQVPLAYGTGGDGQRHRGLGNLGVGFKYRFLHESEGTPQMALYPSVLAPAGGGEVLGDSHWRLFLPLWAQKGFGPWSLVGGGGWMRNPGQGNRDYTVAGLLLQRQLAEGYSVGVEVFHQGASDVDDPGFSTWNIGFECALTSHLQLVGSGGEVFRGVKGTQFYLGLRGHL